MIRYIHLLWVTADTRTFGKTHKFWLSTAKDPDRIRTKVAVDTAADKERLSGFDVLVTTPPHVGVAYPAYQLTRSFSTENLDDVIVLASDDFFPPQDWDCFILDVIDENCCLMVNDGITAATADGVTLPILDYRAFLKLNKILYHKVYHHFLSDCEMFYNCKDLGLLKNVRKVSPVFEHRHHTNGKRKKSKRDILFQKHHLRDIKTFRERMTLSVEKRLEIT